MNRSLSLFLAVSAMFAAHAAPWQGDSVAVNETSLLPSAVNVQASNDTTGTQHPSPRPLIAIGEVMGTDLVIHSLCRFILDEPYANTSLHSIHSNLSTGPKWDNDHFYLNHMGHPYQGNLHFNAARSNGMGFWQSVPYSFAGSLLWEMTCETEPPAINDLVTTTFAGAAIGEVANRLSGRIIDDSQRGLSRFVRETAAAIINPLQGFNRLVSGKAWKVRSNDAQPDETIPATFTLSLGTRHLVTPPTSSTQDPSANHHRTNLMAAFSMEYGSVVNGESHPKPYDYFTFDTEFSITGNQPLLSHMYIMGRLLSLRQAKNMEWGLYQHFRYEEARLADKEAASPFPIGEMASVGPGFIWACPQLSPRLKAEQGVFVSGVAMGAINSDYYAVADRTYNLGSGYAAATRTRLHWQGIADVQLDARFMHLFTWKGYEHKDLSTIDPQHLNAQGDRSNARVFSVALKANAHITEALALSVGATYTTRHTHYHCFPDRHADCYECRAALSWHF